ncbi:MAG: Holliday junction resolvase RuvX [Gammaproteobacteria bacterium]
MSDTLKPQGIIIAFDFGLRRIGVAVGQTVTKTATPEGMVPAQDGEPSWEILETFIRKWKPKALVVGVPLNMDGTEQKMTLNARAFIDKLKERLKLPVFGVDERLTTVEARARLFESGGYKAIQKSSVDAMAAKILLEAWLEENY